jgi:hypothetical protein
LKNSLSHQERIEKDAKGVIKGILREGEEIM